MNISRIVKNVLPAVVVLAAGVFGMNFIYNTYMKSAPSSVISLEPAAGEGMSSESATSGATAEPMAAAGESTAEETPVPSEGVAANAGEVAPKTDCATAAAKVEGAAEGSVAADGSAAPATTDCMSAPEAAPAVEGTTEEAPAAD